MREDRIERSRRERDVLKAMAPVVEARRKQSERVPMDASLHDGLEGRGESGVLTAMIEDAIPQFHRWFTVKAVSPNHAPRPWQPSQNLEAILGRQVTCVPANDDTLRLDHALAIQTGATIRGYANK